ncbi:MAG: maleylpyruvate isomerase N-terminal domain-containing protein, partial [Pyrinomonadaceae bacterium]|nr:maleylpyruvate isomerase N-terminal domain-containing protein [Pyrinomonadaceae bacterium]
MNDDLRFPIGKYDSGQEITPELRRKYIQTIKDLPENIENAVANLTDEQMDTPYRPEGWTVRQTVHHIADSHLNSYCRF